MQSLERSSVHYHMKQIHFARDILKLDGANASIIAKRVGRSPATVRKWMREGIPKSAQDDCLKAVKRHSSALKAARARASGIGPRASAREKSRSPKKSARIPPKPVRGKPQKIVSRQSSVVSQKGSRSSVVGQKKPKLSDRKPKTDYR